MGTHYIVIWKEEHKELNLNEHRSPVHRFIYTMHKTVFPLNISIIGNLICINEDEEFFKMKMFPFPLFFLILYVHMYLCKHTRFIP